MTWQIWVIAGLALAIVEMFTLDFTFLMLGLAALATAGVALGTDILWIQIIAYGIFALILLFFARPWARRHINPRGAAVGNVEAQVGRRAYALTEITERGGRVKIGGDEWSARTTEGRIPEGGVVLVQAIDGATAIVTPES
ncbi:MULTISPECIES: NfeD family protein [Actinotignum]|uniref:NfeD family protein n=1 Tax=Actinotignum TaxID=1653174 RepID=UPI00254C8B80|nr:MULTISPECIES: NfeD family protein [Actinotignum]MDE1536392.1 NfeD family protein [Actinotignum schaalii]MDK7271965.1 NfeD family protein [Actinotignum schaalii]MDY5144112.1 NfeD family protein [Actinotignum timonense]